MTIEEFHLHARTWRPPEYRVLSLMELTHLPPVNGRANDKCGVYFLFKWRGSLLYVGMSAQVNQRVCTHRGQKRIPFDVATYLEVPWPWHLALEALYIRAHDPYWNRTALPTKAALESGAYARNDFFSAVP